MTAPTGQPSPFPVSAWPTETFETGRRYVYLNDEGIEVIHQPAAHTDGDATVFFRRSDVIVTGDIFDTTRFPVIDLERGGSLQGTIQALNRMIATAIPSLPDVSREVGTSVIPGHGHVGDQFDLPELPRHARHRSRPRSGFDRKGDDAGASQSGQSDARVQTPVWIRRGGMDDGHVCRSCVQQLESQEMRSAFATARLRRDWRLLISLVVAVAVIDGPLALAQGRSGGPSKPARELAPIDVTGNWVSYVTEDWRFRMITPPKGDYTRVPLTPEGRKLADGGIRRPMKRQASSARRTALRPSCGFRRDFASPGRMNRRCASRVTRACRRACSASRRRHRRANGRGRATRSPIGTPLSKKLVVTTTSLRAGYLRRNGVPYSADARVTEFFVVAPFGQDDQVFIVTTVVDDPQISAAAIRRQLTLQARHRPFQVESCTMRHNLVTASGLLCGLVLYAGLGFSE